MGIYAKKLTQQQREALEFYESVTGLEPLYQDDLDNGITSFLDVWHLNIAVVDDMLSAVQNYPINEYHES